MSLTRGALLRQATERLAAAGIADAARDARVLLRWAGGLSAAALSTSLHDAAPDAERVRFDGAVDQRLRNVPVSHLTGERMFWGHAFLVTADVLDPRPETETLVAHALTRPFKNALDLGTGSGCILLSLLAERSEAVGTGIDCSEGALNVAKRNAEALGLSDRATFQAGDWLTGVSGLYDLVVSNPPYIAESEMADLSADVRDHEPHLALTPGGDGLQAYREIARDVGRCLAPNGVILLEIGPSQARDVCAILTSNGLNSDPPLKDMDGRDRVIVAHR